MSSSGRMATTRPAASSPVRRKRSLRATAETAPIKVLIYNGSGSDLQLFKLDAEGKRAAFGTIGEEMTFPVTTYVDSPWVIADGAGKCLEIVLPGQQTRFHTVEANGRPGGAVLPRTVPLAGSEATLRRYIEAVGRGEPDYDRMTSEVAAQTRQQLPFNQAIVSRLGDPARDVVPGRLRSRQRHLYRPVRQWFGGVADRPAQGRHDRTDCAGSAVLERFPAKWRPVRVRTRQKQKSAPFRLSERKGLVVQI